MNYDILAHLWPYLAVILQAVDYYEAALSTSIQYVVCLELAELLLKLKHFEKAQQVLEKALDHKESN